jgi:hypothetical protein
MMMSITLAELQAISSNTIININGSTGTKSQADYLYIYPPRSIPTSTISIRHLALCMTPSMPIGGLEAIQMALEKHAVISNHLAVDASPRSALSPSSQGKSSSKQKASTTTSTNVLRAVAQYEDNVSYRHLSSDDLMIDECTSLIHVGEGGSQSLPS